MSRHKAVSKLRVSERQPTRVTQSDDDDVSSENKHEHRSDYKLD